MRKALAQSQSPLAEGPLGLGAPGCLAARGSALSIWPRGPAKATHWEEEIPWSLPNRGDREGEETLLDELANF